MLISENVFIIIIMVLFFFIFLTAGKFFLNKMYLVNKT